MHDFCRQYGVAKLGVQLAHAGPQGPDHGAGGRRQADPGRTGRLDAGSALGHPLRHRLGGAARHDQGRHQALHRRIRRRGQARRPHRLRRDRAARRARLSRPISSCRRSPTSAPTNTAARSKTACALPSRCTRRCARYGRKQKPIGMRVSATDWVEGGWTPEETVVLAKELKKRGMDYMDVSSGGLSPAQKIPLGARLPGAVRREGEEGKRHHHHDGRPDRRLPAGGRHRRRPARPI